MTKAEASLLDCLCAGIVVADHVCEPVDHVPAPGELVLSTRMDLSIGGCAANVAVDLARLGRTVAVAGAVGDDVFGRFIRERLGAAGVGCERLRDIPGRDTSGTLVINTRGEDRRFIHSLGANTSFTGSELDEATVRSARVLYLGGYLLYDELTAELAAAAFQRARAAGVLTVLDVVLPAPGEYRARLDPVLPLTDVFLPNSDEARLLTGLADPIEQAAEFRRRGAGRVVVTCGSGGAVVDAPEGRLRCGVYGVEFRDGTGSGDAFAAGFIHGLLGGSDLRRCLTYGTALGASCVRAAGATTGVFDAAALEAFIAAQELPVEEL
ncbi:MAG: carbohydrate kinase family protein [Planctomycetes bacterium]|nr:carbohydrate kinase family protein [Planctomycetota bacterium]